MERIIEFGNELNKWSKKDRCLFFKETEREYVVLSCAVFVSIDNNEHIYGPSIHRINKSKFNIDDINDFANSTFGSKAKSMSLYQKIIYLSVFTKSCEDLVDYKGHIVTFTFGDDKREASDKELEDKFLSIISEFNL